MMKFLGLKVSLDKTGRGTILPSSPDDRSTLDLDRDLPTTAADVEALRRCRPARTPFDLRDINSLSPTGFEYVDLSRRPTFRGMPPFEL